MEAFFLVLDVLDAIYLRRSIREFKDEKIPVEILEIILNAARFAPSPENSQQWRFIISRDSELKKIVADICQERAQDIFGGQPYETTQERMWYLPERIRLRALETTINGELFRYPEKADVLIFSCYSDRFHDIPFPDSIYVTGTSSLVSLSMAIQNMLLAATALGIGCGFMAIPFGDKRYSPILIELLGIPPSWKPLTVLCLGIPKKTRIIGPSRFPLEAIVFDEQWGRPYKRISFKEE